MCLIHNACPTEQNVFCWMVICHLSRQALRKIITSSQAHGLVSKTPAWFAQGWHMRCRGNIFVRCPTNMAVPLSTRLCYEDSITWPLEESSGSMSALTACFLLERTCFCNCQITTKQLAGLVTPRHAPHHKRATCSGHSHISP